MADVCKEYGGGLYLLSSELKQESVFFEELMTIKGILDESPEYVRLLSSPAVGSSERKALIEQAFGGRVHEYILNFMLLLCDRGYFSYMSGCVETFKKTYYEKCNISEGTVKSAYDLSEAEKQKLTEALTKKIGNGKKLILNFVKDESVLGGFLAEIDGIVVDSTLKTKLSSMKNVLSKPV